MIADTDIVLARQRIVEPRDIRLVLSARIREMLEAPGKSAEVRVVRLVVHVAPLDPFAWLDANPGNPRIYWCGRDQEMQVAAVGTADVCEGDARATYDTLRAQLDPVFSHSDAQTRYYGGFRFDRATSPDDVWAPFGTYRFVLPRFEVNVSEEQAILACNLVLPRDVQQGEALLAAVEQLAFPISPLVADLPLPVARRDTPDASAWRSRVEGSLESFETSDLEKIVLARRADFDFAEPLDPIALMKGLRGTTPGCFHFYFEPEEGTAFLGASPERLFRREGRSVWSEAVAGTRPRGETLRADDHFRNELLASDKDQREHAYVRRSIEEALEPLCEALEVDASASAMELARGWHLISRIQATLMDGVAGSDVMWAIHPTPAVGGYPTSAAMATIREVESFDRGWYAGPVGWIGTRGAEFAVAIRSGLARARRLSLYSGAGIVAGSDPEDEWTEIEQKISDFTKVLGLL